MLDTTRMWIIAAVALGLATPAVAGRVGEINKKVGKQTTRKPTTRRPPSPGSKRPPPTSRPTRRPHTGRRDGVDWVPPRRVIVTPTVPSQGCVGCVASAQVVESRTPGLPTEPVILDVHLVGQKVANSDGSVTFAGRVANGFVGIGASITNYFEETSPMLGVPGSASSSQLRLWSVTMQARALKIGNETELWVESGYSELQGTGFENLSGFITGVSAMQRLGGSLTGGATARAFWLEDEIRGHELSARVSASIFSIGYRYMNLNLGPPLYGPEIGFTTRF